MFAEISIEDIDNGSSDNCGISDIQISQTQFTDEHVGENIISLTVTDNYGNISSCDAIVTVDAGLGVDNISLKTIRLHPNPTSDIINISGNFSGLSFVVYDLLGKKIFKGNTSRIIDTSKLEKGIYLIEFSSSNQKAVRKIIKN